MSEFEQYLRNSYWHLICHKSELKSSKEFVRFDWLNEEIVVFRDGDSYVAFDNKCPHRGARMYVGEYGKQPAVCPYHGWSYSAEKVMVADAASFTQCSLRDVALNKLQTKWCGEFLFVAIAARQTLEEQLGALWGRVESVSRCINGRADFSHYMYECDWKIALENALEPYHVPLVHPTSLGALKLSVGENEFHGVNSVWYSEVKNERMAKRLAGLRRMFSIEYQYSGYMSIYLFPFAMLSSTFGYSYSLQNFFPSAQPEKTYFNSRLLASKLSEGVEEGVMSSFFESTANVNRQVFEEDHQICRRVHGSTWSANPPRYYSDKEVKLLHFRKSCLDVMSKLEGNG